MHTLKWNPNTKLVLADVDETIAEVYTPAEPEMIAELTRLMEDGVKIFMVTGGSLKRVRAGITDLIDPGLRQNMLISHCSGAEVWGFTSEGDLQSKPFYSVYEEHFTDDMKQNWREVVNQLVEEFQLRTHSVRPKTVFWDSIGSDPHDIMLDDRGPQITLEVVNGIDLTDEQCDQFKQDIPLTHDGRRDLRLALMQRVSELLAEKNVPITPHLGGVFALDLAVEGSSKTTSIKYVLETPEALSAIGLAAKDLTDPLHFEIWGDKFSEVNGGSDRFMSIAMPLSVRSIDFREEDPSEFPDGYNIVVWDGQKRLHHGLLEYLQMRGRTA